MLVIERTEGQAVWIGRHVKAVITKVRDGNRVRIAFEAPREIRILREELKAREQPAAEESATPPVAAELDAPVRAASG